MNNSEKYDIAIAGGGLTGLAAARALSMAGYKVALFEKKIYPFHRVCGEYLSAESLPFLEQLGFEVDGAFPFISQFKLSLPSGRSVQTRLPQGGIGISRFHLDYSLVNLCYASGADIWENTTVKNISRTSQGHFIETSQGNFEASVCIGSWGKRSGMDKTLERDFATGKVDPDKHFIGVKYHIDAALPPDRIELIVFDKGYCGISRVEDDRFCMCYLTTAANLKKYGTIAEMEKQSLSSNPVLKEYLDTFPRLFQAPQVISQIPFGSKDVTREGILMAGDAAGVVSPLNGNGMSMGLHAAAFLSPLVADFLENKISREQMERQYSRWWKDTFSTRIRTGKWLQKLFFKPALLDLMVPILNAGDVIKKQIVKSTHGKPFSLPEDFIKMRHTG